MTKKIDSILNSFPKIRKDLPNDFKKIYQKIYLDNREGRGIGNKISQFSEKWAHKIIEKRYNYRQKNNCLEIGAGNLNHIPYLQNNNELYDIVEPEEWFYKDNFYLDRVNSIYQTIYDVPLNNSYDRIISIMVLEHVLDLPNFIQRCKNLLKIDGMFQAAIPCEGELAWYLAWRLGTSSTFWLKYKKDWGTMIRHEHVNNLKEITSIIDHFFGNFKIIRSPVPFMLQKKHFSFYAYIEAKKN